MIYDSQEWDGVNVPTAYIDFLGQEIHVGDYVAYATSSNHSANIVVGQLLEFTTHNAKGEPYGSTVRIGPYIQGQPQETEFHHRWNMKIQPLIDSRFKWRGGIGNGIKKKIVLGTVMNVHKVDVSRANIEVYDEDS